MVIRIINEFHNVDFTVIPNGDITLSKYKTYVRRACNQKECRCSTKVYMKVTDLHEADLHTFNQSGPNNTKYIVDMWKLIDPTDLDLRDKGYGVKL